MTSLSFKCPLHLSSLMDFICNKKGSRKYRFYVEGGAVGQSDPPFR